MRLALGAASLLGWLVLADFDSQYFRYIVATGGRADATYRTADVEPKVAALRTILDQRTAGTTWIASSQWNIDLPLYYMAMAEPDVRVVPEEHFRPFVAPLEGAIPWDEVWHVEFAGPEGLEHLETRLGARPMRRWPVPAYDGQTVLWVLHGE